MALPEVKAHMRQKTGTTAEWTANDDVLHPGQIGFEDLGDGFFKAKVGDGTSAYSGMDYNLLPAVHDNDYHSGKVYQALGFKYYGLSAPKKDFWYELDDGTFKKHSRGPTKGIKGEWRDRSRKHRYLKIYDKSFSVKWVEEKYP